MFTKDVDPISLKRVPYGYAIKLDNQIYDARQLNKWIARDSSLPHNRRPLTEYELKVITYRARRGLLVEVMLDGTTTVRRRMALNETWLHLYKLLSDRLKIPMKKFLLRDATKPMFVPNCAVLSNTHLMDHPSAIRGYVVMEVVLSKDMTWDIPRSTRKKLC